jgi:hypothetical protein
MNFLRDGKEKQERAERPFFVDIKKAPGGASVLVTSSNIRSIVAAD